MHSKKAGRVFVALFLFLMCAAHSHASNIYLLSVPITSPWYDTGIDVTSGMRLGINASGTVTYGPFGGQTTGPNGGDGSEEQPLTLRPFIPGLSS
jgi:hypothetical protein